MHQPNLQTTVAALLAASPAHLRKDTARLMGELFDRPLAWVYANLEYLIPNWEHVQQLHHRLLAGEPLAYLTNTAYFYGLQLTVTPDVLIPRPDSEILIEAALDLDMQDTATVLDFGCGSGALACALAAHRPRWHIHAADASLAALGVTATNAARHGVDQRVTTWLVDWWHMLPPMAYDLIITNPPYIDPSDPALSRSVLTYEPAQALFATDQGLGCYHTILSGMADYGHNATLICEHGYQQQPSLIRLARHYGLEVVAALSDYHQHNRALVLRLSSS